MEAGIEGEVAGIDAGDVIYLVGYGIPLAIDFFGRGFSRWFDGVSFYD